MRKIVVLLVALLLQVGQVMAQNFYDTLMVFKMDLDSVVVTAKSKGKYRTLSKKEKISIIERFKAKVYEDFPEQTENYKVLSRLKVTQGNEDILRAELEGNLTVIPKILKNNRDSLGFELTALISMYYNDKLNSNLESVKKYVSDDDDDDNDEADERVDNSLEQIWGKNPYAIVSALSDSPKSWDYIDNKDGTALLVYRYNISLLGIIKGTLRVNFVINSTSFELLNLVHEEFMYVKIPFGGKKIKGEDLGMLNALNMTGVDYDSFKLKVVDSYIKQYANFNDKKPEYKALDLYIKMEGDEGKKIDMGVNGTIKVLDK